jgi:hypothetical protein
LHWKVGEYINLPYGAKRIAHAYMQQYIEDRNEELQQIFGSGEEG